MMDKANDNGFSLIVNGTDSNELQLVLYPFRETIVSQEQIARQIFEILSDNGVTANKKTFQRFKEDVEPDDIEHHVFIGDSEDNSKNETRIIVFHNKNLLLKYIKIKVMLIHQKFAFSVVSFACAIIMWQAMKNTCPPKEQHLQAVTDVVEKAVDRIFEERVVLPEESKDIAEYLSAKVIPQAVAKLTQQRIDFTSYGIFSLGKIIVPDGEDTPVYIGLFGKVFTVSEDDAYEYLNGLINESDVDNILQEINKEENGNNDVENNEG